MKGGQFCVQKNTKNNNNYADWLMVPGNHSKAILCLVNFCVQNVCLCGSLSISGFCVRVCS